jgi:hypothetical protein
MLLTSVTATAHADAGDAAKMLRSLAARAKALTATLQRPFYVDRERRHFQERVQRDRENRRIVWPWL